MGFTRVGAPAANLGGEVIGLTPGAHFDLGVCLVAREGRGVAQWWHGGVRLQGLGALGMGGAGLCVQPGGEQTQGKEHWHAPGSQW
jgi:hypothetical protein